MLKLVRLYVIDSIRDITFTCFGKKISFIHNQDCVLSFSISGLRICYNALIKYAVVINKMNGDVLN